MYTAHIRHLAIQLQNNLRQNIPLTRLRWMSKSFQTQERCLSAVPKSVNVQPDKPDWRESASLMIMSKDNATERNDSEFDYSMLMVKRSRSSSFFASAYVFPGGVVEQFDFSPKWYDLYAKNGIDQPLLDDSISGHITGPRVPMVSNPITIRPAKEGFLNSDIALRISSIRETFEEAGVLLLSNPNDRNQSEHTAVSLSDNELKEWQTKVRNDSTQFYALCDSLKLVPNIWSLHEWSNWLTPIAAHQRRYDTLFYVCQLNQRPKVRIDNAEVTQTQWCHPGSILSDFQNEKVFLAPPQVYEISRLHHYSEIDQLQKYTSQRQVHGTERWIPFMLTFDNGMAFVLPGDFRYPKNPDLISRDYESIVKGSVDHDVDAGPLNRTVIKDSKARVQCNVDPGAGHLRPLLLDD